MPQRCQPLLICEPQPGAAKLRGLTHGEEELAQLVAGPHGKDLRILNNVVPGVGLRGEDAGASLGFLASVVGLWGPGKTGVGAKVQEQRM